MIRVGVIGVGWWANSVHVRGILSHPQAELVALCCRGEEKLKAAGCEFGVGALYSDYRELLARDDLDAVTISTTHNAHYPVALAALERGLHVFCEKPLGLNSRETEHLARAAREAGVRTMVAFTSRWVPEARVAQRMLAEGAIGDLLHYTVTKFASYGGPKSRWMWRADPALAGGGVLFDLGCHVIDLAQWLIAPLQVVCASQKTLVPERLHDGERLPTPVDDSTAFLGEFATGLQGVFHISWTAIGSRLERHEICGEGGTLILNLDHDNWINALHISRPGDPEPEPVPIPDWAQGRIPRDVSTTEKRQIAHQAFIENHPSLVRAFIDAILAGEDAPPTFADGHATQRAMDAILASDQERRWCEA
jgi:myo-inositol 2-dehydrogenase/D-chiro-inositol 1-dehydrogenase